MDKKYTYAIGRRKTSVATVRLYESTGNSIVNEKELSKIYPGKVFEKMFNKPFEVADLDPKKFMYTVKVVGGGHKSQMGAILLGVSRAIVALYPEKKTSLKKESLLTRDSRKVERKKPGLRKARKAEQYSKR